jgi:hypothetical protein
MSRSRACSFGLAIAVAVLAGGDGSASAVTDSTAVPDWTRRLSISGSVLGEARWLQRSLAPRRAGSGSSDLFIRLVELGFETEFSNVASGTLVLNSEYLGDARTPGDGWAAVDEVHADLHTSSSVFNFTFGQRTQPFGVFENPLLSDPMTQDGYETKVVGASLGVTGTHDLDLSLTAYKGDVQMEHLIQSGLFDASAVARPPVAARHVDSWIAAGTVTPWKDVLSVFASCLSEGGHDRRNLTLNTGLGLNVPPLGNARLDFEMMRALRRETFAGRESREDVVSISASHPIVFRPSRPRNRGLYRARRLFTQSHPFNVAMRWERFDDHGLGRALGAWTVRDRIALGGKYTLFERGPEAVYGAAEYRNTRYRLPEGSTGLVPSAGEVELRVGVEF